MRKKPPEDCEVPMSTLIDIVFLLIIFFVFTASTQNEVVDYSIKLAQSHYVKPEEVVDPRTFILNVKRNELDVIVFSIAGHHMSLDQIRDQLIRAVAVSGNDFPVVIRASANLEYRIVDKLNLVITDAGLYRVQHATLSKYED
ncbi:MAG: biopolymer transporter ExbD [Lentisphaeria bacterium]|nr:biopolymer transporter ExbD [Lentisphaeria bacterium]NQZ67941.1 biopolymer transporter ExbD [Lentisphaeria bacterium]